jgi:hypothetical protein
LQAHHVRARFGPDEYRAAGASFDQGDAPQDQRAHDAFAELGLLDHHGTQIFRRNEQRLHVAGRMHVDQRRPARQLGDFGDDPGPSSTIGARCPKGSRRLTETVPEIRTDRPGAMSPVTSSGSPVA